MADSALAGFHREGADPAVEAVEFLIDADEVARRLCLPVSWIREEARARRIPARKCGKYWRFLWSEVRAWRDSKPIRTGPRV